MQPPLPETVLMSAYAVAATKARKRMVFIAKVNNTDHWANLELFVHIDANQSCRTRETFHWCTSTPIWLGKARNRTCEFRHDYDVALARKLDLKVSFIYSFLVGRHFLIIVHYVIQTLYYFK
jgi:hypothetical protein